jgi:hypothetical protein
MKRECGVPPNNIPPATTTTLNPPRSSGLILRYMLQIFVIAGYSIVAMSLSEAFKYFREYCVNANG